MKFDLLEFKKLEGEATANNRKAKLIFLFEWEIEIKFQGWLSLNELKIVNIFTSFLATVAGSDIVYEGHLEIPNLSDENEASEVDVVVELTTRGTHENEIKHIGNHEIRDLIRQQLETYIRELKEEFSKGLILPTEKPKPQVISQGKTNVVDKRAFQNEVIADKKASQSKPVSSGPVEVKSFETRETMKVPPERLYEILTQPDLVKAWTNGPAQIDAKSGGSFSLLGGQITGTFDGVKENQELIMKWRLKKYPSNHFAKITMTLKDQVRFSGCSRILNITLIWFLE